MIGRFLFGAPGAVVVTALLFLILAALIQQRGDVRLSEDKSVNINITRQIEETAAQADQADFRRPVLDQPPPPPPTVYDASFRPTVSGQIGSLPDFSQTDLDIGTGFNPDRDAQPLVRIPPQYPENCQSRAKPLEFVVVEFNVTPEGAVVDPKVVESSNSCFERSALRSVERWKYQPKVIDNQAQARLGVRTQITFRLAE
jgi:protein TonB